MKIIHCADLHLDSKMESNLDREKAVERKSELFDTFCRMAEYAKLNEVKVIIIAGDLFDTSKNMQLRVKRRVLSVIRDTPDTDFLYIKGNHDSEDFLEGEDLPENLKLFSREGCSYEYANVLITGKDYKKGMTEKDWSEFCAKLKNDPEKINILVLHEQEGKSFGKEGSVNMSVFKDLNIDYLALGHIHSYKCHKLDKRGVYCYSGCLEGRGFDECGDKGFVLLETEEDQKTGGRLRHSFVPFAKRRIHDLRLKLDGGYSREDIEELISEKIKDIPETDMVKLTFSGEVEEDTDIDIEFLQKKYGEGFYFMKMCDETKLKLSYEDYENDISLKGEFIRLVKGKRMREEDKREIILMGLRALSDREIDIWR